MLPLLPLHAINADKYGNTASEPPIANVSAAMPPAPSSWTDLPKPTPGHLALLAWLSAYRCQSPATEGRGAQ
jgi:hypothetical protein